MFPVVYAHIDFVLHVLKNNMGFLQQRRCWIGPMRPLLLLLLVTPDKKLYDQHFYVFLMDIMQNIFIISMFLCDYRTRQNFWCSLCCWCYCCDDYRCCAPPYLRSTSKLSSSIQAANGTFCYHLRKLFWCVVNNLLLLLPPPHSHHLHRLAHWMQRVELSWVYNPSAAFTSELMADDFRINTKK